MTLMIVVNTESAITLMEAMSVCVVVDMKMTIVAAA